MSAIALAAWNDANVDLWANPSSPYRGAARAKIRLDEARKRIAFFLGCAAGEIVFTSGATEAAYWIFSNLVALVDPTKKVLINPSEHPCVLDAAKKFFGNRLSFTSLDEGRIVLRDVEKQVDSTVGLVVTMAANNETGVIQPWREIAVLCADRKIPLVCDASQWLGKIPASGLGSASWVIGAAHKFGGPKGVGFLKFPLDVDFHSFVGGEQESGHRAGTENVPGVLSMVAALADAEETKVLWEVERLRWRREFEIQIKDAVPGTVIVGESSERLWNTVSLIMPAGENIRWVSKLDKLGFQVSTGSACATSKAGMSHVLGAMGYSVDESKRSIRVSSSWETSREEWQGLVAALRSVHAEICRSSASLH